MLEAATDEKSSNALSTDAYSQNKAETVGTSVATTRKTVESLEKTRQSQDLLAVCALLQRQHDFLKQNAANMERWCHDNLTEEEFAGRDGSSRPHHQTVPYQIVVGCCLEVAWHPIQVTLTMANSTIAFGRAIAVCLYIYHEVVSILRESSLVFLSPARTSRHVADTI